MTTPLHPGRLPALTKADLVDDAGRELWDKMTTGAQSLDDQGRMLGIFNVWLYTPEAGSNLVATGRALLWNTVLDRRIAELAICATCAFWQWSYALKPHVPLARELGVPDAVLAALEAGKEPEFTDARDQVVYDVAMALARSGTIDAELYSRAAACFGERELVELVLMCNWYTMNAHTSNALLSAPGNRPAAR